MSYHSDSDEQVQTIKEFLASTWKTIVAVLLIGLLSIWGWRYWQSYQTEKTVQASDKYEQLIAKIDSNDSASIDELVIFAKETDTIYSVFADLRAAQFYVEVRQDYAGALELLEHALKQTDSEPVIAMVNIRIARLQHQLEKYDDSIKTLDKVKETSWAAVVNDIRGDVLVKMENYQGAINAYETALASTPVADLEKNLKMKLNNAQYLLAKQKLEQEKIAEENRKLEEAQKAAAEAEAQAAAEQTLQDVQPTEAEQQ